MRIAEGTRVEVKAEHGRWFPATIISRQLDVDGKTLIHRVAYDGYKRTWWHNMDDEEWRVLTPPSPSTPHSVTFQDTTIGTHKDGQSPSQATRAARVPAAAVDDGAAVETVDHAAFGYVALIQSAVLGHTSPSCV